MRCKYCNAEVSPIARYCSKCGGDLSIFDKCVSCGEYIDKGSSTCPLCGAPQYVDNTKQTVHIILGVTLSVVAFLLIVGGGWWFYTHRDLKIPSISSISSTEEEEEVISVEGAISMDDVIKVADNIIMENGDYKGLRSKDEVDNIMQNKCGYNYVKKYYSYNQFNFEPLYYKDCMLDRSGTGTYSVTPIENGDGISSFIGIDTFTGNIVFASFSESVFNGYLHQIEQLGGKKVQENEGAIRYQLNHLDITALKKGVHDIPYPIFVRKAEPDSLQTLNQ